MSRPPAPRVILVHPRGERAAACCDALRLSGLDARHTVEPEAALSMLVEIRASAIVLDLRLPGIDVLDLAAAIRRHERTVDVVVIALADSVASDAMALAMARGCDRVLRADAPARDIARETERVLAERDGASKPIPVHAWELGGTGR